ncbi:MAG TPA: hypothetical protein VF736_06925 [Pyrinomonadaceae bacterium]|jgi:hypothetical protein
MPDNKFTVSAQFEGATDKEKPTDVALYAFDAKGNFLGSAPLDKGPAPLALPANATTQAVRVFVGPRLDEGVQPTPALLQRLGAVEDRRLLDPRNPKLQVNIPTPIWKLWPICSCVVRGHVVKRQPQPDGSVRDLPVCHTRVTICEVDRLPFIIMRLPDAIAFRLRDELIKEIVRPLPVLQPVPPVPPLPDPPPILRLAPNAAAGAAVVPKAASAARPPAAPAAAAPSVGLQSFDLKTQMSLNALARTTSAPELRTRLADLHLVIRPLLCLWEWVHPWFFTRVDCLKTVNVDENGRFQTVIKYLCAGDKPDLYFKVEQLQGGVWKSIYAPPIPCHTYWNYNCGSDVTIVVTDPSAIACVPQDPVVSGEATWVMPYAVGGTVIWGSPPSATPAPNGRVRTDGFTDYGGISGAPFGSLLGFRMGYSNNITGSAAIKYFRWSYRKAGDAAWTQMDLPVSRHYVKTVPGAPNPIISFPTYQLGPRTVGAQTNLYEFKPPAPPLPTPPDPAGTTTAWPVDNWFDDIYAAFLDTLALPGTTLASAGQYQIRLEVFGPSGDVLTPGAGTFRFIVPTTIDPDNTVHTRQATAAEMDGNAFVFNLQIDNNKCEAEIFPTSAGATSVADACGFLRYSPGDSFTLAFTARHPNDRATFGFSVVRGMTGVPAATAAGEVAGPTVGAYTRNASSRYSGTFSQVQLLDTCVNAAFAESLVVNAKVTNGWGRLGGAYDKAALAAFALAAK